MAADDTITVVEEPRGFHIIQYILFITYDVLGGGLSTHTIRRYLPSSARVESIHMASMRTTYRHRIAQSIRYTAKQIVPARGEGGHNRLKYYAWSSTGSYALQTTKTMQKLSHASKPGEFVPRAVISSVDTEHHRLSALMLRVSN